MSDIRSRLGSSAELGEHKRDTDDALSKLTAFKAVEVADIYTEPMYVAFDHEPKGVLALRVRNDAALETPVLCGTYCSFTWDGSTSRVRIDQIDGLTPGTGTKYRFVFGMVG